MGSRKLLVPLLLLEIACSSTSRGSSERPPAKQAAANESVPTTLDVGQRAPPFAVDSSTGTGKVTLEPGSVGLVLFWATWNGPAKKSFPKLETLHRKYGARGLQIAALSVDESNVGCVEPNGWGDKCPRQGDLIAQAARDWGASFPVGWDAGLRIARQWAPPNMPMVYVIDRQGVVRHKHGGWHDGYEEELEREILLLL